MEEKSTAVGYSGYITFDMCSTTPKSAKTEYTPEQFAVASMLPEFRQAEPQPQCLGGIKEECRMPHNFGASVKIKKNNSIPNSKKKQNPDVVIQSLFLDIPR